MAKNPDKGTRESIAGGQSWYTERKKIDYNLNQIEVNTVLS